MRVLVCGGRDYDDWEALCRELEPFLTDGLVIIQGGAKGADFLARVWAKWRKVDQEEYPADWTKFGKGAGSIRNQRMLDEGKPDVVLAFPGGSGTRDMVSKAERSSIHVVKIENKK